MLQASRGSRMERPLPGRHPRRGSRPRQGHRMEAAFSLPVLLFEAQKWRSPLGAYWFTDCMAVWPEMGSWESYSVGGEMIS